MTTVGLEQQQLLIDGEWTAAASGATFGWGVRARSHDSGSAGDRLGVDESSPLAREISAGSQGRRARGHSEASSASGSSSVAMKTSPIPVATSGRER